MIFRVSCRLAQSCRSVNLYAPRPNGFKSIISCHDFIVGELLPIPERYVQMYTTYIDVAQYGGAWIEEDFDLPLITSHSLQSYYQGSNPFLLISAILLEEVLWCYSILFLGLGRNCALVRLLDFSCHFYIWISRVARQDVNVGADVRTRKARFTVLIGCQLPHCLCEYSQTLR